jgi:hypothetical protein
MNSLRVYRSSDNDVDAKQEAHQRKEESKKGSEVEKQQHRIITFLAEPQHRKRSVHTFPFATEAGGGRAANSRFPSPFSSPGGHHSAFPRNRRRLIANQVSVSAIVVVCQYFNSNHLRLSCYRVTPGYLGARKGGKSCHLHFNAFL